MSIGDEDETKIHLGFLLTKGKHSVKLLHAQKADTTDWGGELESPTLYTEDVPQTVVISFKEPDRKRRILFLRL